MKNVDERMEWEESFVSYNFSSLFHPTKVQHLQPNLKLKTNRFRHSPIIHSFQKYILLWVSDQPLQRNLVTKSAGGSDLGNFWR